MSVWAWALVATGVAVGGYAAAVAALAIAGRRTHARAVARFVPDCAVLFGRLARDPRVPRGHRLALLALAGYLATPFDLVPDFLPVIGQLDDAVLAVLVLRALVRSAGPQVVRDNWPGPEPSLRALLRAAGAPPPAVA